MEIENTWTLVKNYFNNDTMNTLLTKTYDEQITYMNQILKFWKDECGWSEQYYTELLYRLWEYISDKRIELDRINNDQKKKYGVYLSVTNKQLKELIIKLDGIDCDLPFNNYCSEITSSLVKELTRSYVDKILINLHHRYTKLLLFYVPGKHRLLHNNNQYKVQRIQTLVDKIHRTEQLKSNLKIIYICPSNLSDVLDYLTQNSIQSYLYLNDYKLVYSPDQLYQVLIIDNISTNLNTMDLIKKLFNSVSQIIIMDKEISLRVIDSFIHGDNLYLLNNEQRGQIIKFNFRSQEHYAWNLIYQLLDNNKNVSIYSSDLNYQSKLINWLDTKTSKKPIISNKDEPIDAYFIFGNSHTDTVTELLNKIKKCNTETIYLCNKTYDEYYPDTYQTVISNLNTKNNLTVELTGQLYIGTSLNDVDNELENNLSKTYFDILLDKLLTINGFNISNFVIHTKINRETIINNKEIPISIPDIKLTLTNDQLHFLINHRVKFDNILLEKSTSIDTLLLRELFNPHLKLTSLKLYYLKQLCSLLNINNSIDRDSIIYATTIRTNFQLLQQLCSKLKIVFDLHLDDPIDYNTMIVIIDKILYRWSGSKLEHVKYKRGGKISIEDYYFELLTKYQVTKLQEVPSFEWLTYYDLYLQNPLKKIKPWHPNYKLVQPVKWFDDYLTKCL